MKPIFVFHQVKPYRPKQYRKTLIIRIDFGKNMENVKLRSLTVLFIDICCKSSHVIVCNTQNHAFIYDGRIFINNGVHDVIQRYMEGRGSKYGPINFQQNDCKVRKRSIFGASLLQYIQLSELGPVPYGSNNWRFTVINFKRLQIENKI